MKSFIIIAFLLTCSLGWAEIKGDEYGRVIETSDKPTTVLKSLPIYQYEEGCHQGEINTHIIYYMTIDIPLGQTPLWADFYCIKTPDYVKTPKQIYKEENNNISIESFPKVFFEYPPEELMKDKKERKKYFEWRKLMEIEIEKDFDDRYKDTI